MIESMEIPWDMPDRRTVMTRDEKYREIQALHAMLERERIDHRFIPYMGGFQITWPYNVYPPIISIIEHDFSYGSKEDLLEVNVRGHIFTSQSATATLEQVRYYNDERETQKGTT